MNIQSASLEVPGTCPNNCKFCVSRISGSNKAIKNVFHFEPELSILADESDGVKRQFIDRLQYLRDKNIDTLILTGSASEPHLNESYLRFFHYCNRLLRGPFINIELQTSGVLLNKEKLSLLEDIGVKTISLSISSFDSKINAEINQTPKKMIVDIKKTCKMVKDFRLNLRLVLNMNSVGFKLPFEEIFEHAIALNIDQINFKKLYFSDSNAPQNKWIKDNTMPSTDDSLANVPWGKYIPPKSWWARLNTYVYVSGKRLDKLASEQIRYSVCGISTVIDTDCMNKINEKIRYLILRKNCKLYSRWDDLGSIIF